MRHLRVYVIYFTWCTTLPSTVVQLRNRRKNVIVYIQSMTLFFVIVYIQTMTLFLSLTAVNDTFWELWEVDWSMTVSVDTKWRDVHLYKLSLTGQ